MCGSISRTQFLLFHPTLFALFDAPKFSAVLESWSYPVLLRFRLLANQFRRITRPRFVIRKRTTIRPIFGVNSRPNSGPIIDSGSSQVPIIDSIFDSILDSTPNNLTPNNSTPINSTPIHHFY